MPKRNIELLTKVRDLIEADQKLLDMSLWARIPFDSVDTSEGPIKVECGTTGCIAGWAVQQAGDKLFVQSEDRHLDYDTGEAFYSVSHSVAKNGRVCDIEVRARKLLGLTRDEADYLFFVENNQVVDLLSALIDGKDILPEGWTDD
ncbi:hypothetical protein MINTMi27_15820 [Mycobacterium intracellulare]|uniref:hypothetical protein n=1 Tax=Mycobacterium intracellulare TaxID=1767 RepID=UPI001928C035|nr:hypothetical protein [Mycobacterium intracellulare]BCP41489.1 hypothetical protein MINTMi27_15820 [Mycobacterium intracellulare]